VFVSVNPITIEALEIIDAIERRGSYAKAAEELNKVTSALSYTVQKLEEQLDITLFQRQGRRSVLTPAGRVVLDEGRKILLASKVLADKAKEVATGWEPRLRIGLESTLDYGKFFAVLERFLNDHPNIEIDIAECVLNGGWEALEFDRLDLIVGVPGPVPQQKGYRAVSIGQGDLPLVAAAHHPICAYKDQREQLCQALEETRRAITHDTSQVNVVRSEGLSDGKQTLYLQTIDQKIQAQLAGVGVGHLPRSRIQTYLDSGELVELLEDASGHEMFIAWKLANKGKALKALVTQLAAVVWI
jgi:DNA-binding transcriptional LysR family regulator